MIRLTAALSLFATASMAEPPRVVTDIMPVHSLTARVMQGVGAPDLLLPPGTDPHHAALTPGQAGDLSAADLVIWVGPALTPWLADPVETLATGSTSLILLETSGWTPLTFRETADFGNLAESEQDAHHGNVAHADGQDGEHHHDHGDLGANHAEHGQDHHDGHDDAHHDGEAHDHHDDAETRHGDHTGGHDGHADAHHDNHADEHDDHAHAAGTLDPHAWLDPDIAAVWMMSIAQALGAMDPANADTYAANAAEGAAEVTALANQLADRMRPLTGRPFVLPHDAFQYFERRFGLAATGAITLSDAAAPGPAHIRDLQSAIADAGVVCILRDHETDAGWIDLLIEGTEARSALIDGTGAALQSGPGAYVAMMEALGDAFANCLT